MAASRWIFTKEQLANTPSRKSGIDADKELSYRQQAATLIQDMGQRLSVTQLCINTAIVYMHRFYMFQTFARFPRNDMAPACLFLAAKVEEQPRKLEHLIKVAHSCLHRDNTPAPDVKSEAYLEQAQTLVINENVLLQTLGFDVTVDHPHTNVVKLTQLVKASKDLSQTSYFLATNSLHMTTFCLQYRPTVVACVCIYLACKWSNWKIPKSNEGKEWFQYIDRSVTQEMLDERYKEFLDILEKYPHKLRKKIMGWKGEKTEGITKADLEPSPSPSSSSGSRHEHRRETSSEHRRETSSEHRRDHERKELHKHEGSGKRESSQQSENKDRGDPNDPRFAKHGSSERKEGHPGDRREQTHGHNCDMKYRDMRDGSEHRHTPSDRKLVPHSKPSTETAGENRSQININHTGNIKPSVSDSIGNNSANKQGSEKDTSLPNTGQSQPNTTSEMHRSKSETTLNYKDYLKRKNQEKMEKERLEREKLEKGRMLNLKMLSESETLNKSFSEISARPEKKETVVKPEKNRPPKLNISSNHPERSNHSSKSNERPYEVNIKSPIKPHHNIKVKSPIKSSDLKQPKLEITKVQITPEKDGSDPFSVNINEDPNLKKMVENIKKEPGATPNETRTESSEGNLSFTNHDRNASPRVKVKQESTSPRVKTKPEATGSPRVKLKNESSETPTKIRQEKNAVDSPLADIQLLPEHTAAPNFKIKELNYDPDRINDSPTSLKLAGKHESGSGRSTPVISQLKSEPGSGASPLKLKIITKGLKPDGDQSSGSSHQGSPHGKHHKHKHKSHKHSKDKHREKHEHRDKHGTNGHPLKMSIKLSNIPGSDSRHKHEKNKLSISDTSLNKNPNSGEFGERQQPWSMSDLMSQSGGNPESSRKRRRTPTVDQNVDVSSHSKQAKVDSHRLRRSSSSHSVVSMELSDGDTDDRTSNGQDKLDQPKVVNQLLETLQQAIDQTKRNNEVALKQQKIRHNVSVNSQSTSGQVRVDRQQSGFDLEGMMWSGTSDQPPLPTETPPPLPMSPPPRHIVPPPPPPPH